jgi:hypothetical protein
LSPSGRVVEDREDIKVLNREVLLERIDKPRSLVLFGFCSPREMEIEDSEWKKDLDLTTPFGVGIREFLFVDALELIFTLIWPAVDDGPLLG